MISRNLQIRKTHTSFDVAEFIHAAENGCRIYLLRLIRLRTRRIRSVQNPFLQVIQRRIQSISGPREFEGRQIFPRSMLSKFCRSQSSGPSSPHPHGWVLYSMCTSASDQYRRSHSCDNSYLPRCCHFSACIYAQSGCMPPPSISRQAYTPRQRYLSVQVAALIQMMQLLLMLIDIARSAGHEDQIAIVARGFHPPGRIPVSSRSPTRGSRITLAVAPVPTTALHPVAVHKRVSRALLLEHAYSSWLYISQVRPFSRSGSV